MRMGVLRKHTKAAFLRGIQSSIMAHIPRSLRIS